MIIGILTALLVYILAIIFHELGHIIYFRSRGIKTKIYYKNMGLEIGLNKDYEQLNSTEYKHLNASGILLGLIPIIISTQWFTYALLLVVPYLVIGCKSDIKNLIEESKK